MAVELLTLVYTEAEVDNLLDEKADGVHTHTGVYQPYDINTVVDATYVATDNNFTTILKTNYDIAYTHSQSAHADINADVTADNETSHTTIDAHLVDSTKHYLMGAISITESQVSDLGDYQTSLGYTPEDILNKGASDGYAELVGGTVPTSQLPAYVDDVLEFADEASFPTTGESGKIYVALDTNLTYRWSGSVYVEISASLVLGETSATAYRGDRGAIAYDHSQVLHAPSDADNTATNETSHSDVLVDSDTLSPVTVSNKIITESDVTGGGDMLKATYDNSGTDGRVDDADKVNGLTVETAVPTLALFTDTDTTYNIQDGELSENNLTNVLKTNYDTGYTHSQTTHAPSDAEANDLTTLLDADIGVNVQAYDINTVVDSGYVHTDNNFTNVLKTNYDTAYTHSQTTHAPSDADNTATNETSHSDVLVDSDTLSPVTVGNKIITESDVTGGGDMLKATYDNSGTDGRVDDADKVNGFTVETAVPALAEFSDTTYTDAEIKTAYENNTNTNEFSDDEQTKLAGLESSHFKGQYIDIGALNTAHPTATIGDYANVDGGIGNDALRYIWDDDDVIWVKQLGSSAVLSDAQIKTQYENNTNTNAFTDGEKSSLATMTDGAEPNDATTLLDADIGINVQAYDINTVVDANYVATDNNFTDALKTNYDIAYTHSQTTHAPSDAEANDATTLLDADIGVNVQAYDINTTKNDTPNTFTAAQRTSIDIAQDNSIDLDVANNFRFTATATSISITSQTVGQGGNIRILSADLITTWGTEFDWGKQGTPTDLTGTEDFAYFVWDASGVDSISIGRV